MCPVLCKSSYPVVSLNPLRAQSTQKTFISLALSLFDLHLCSLSLSLGFVPLNFQGLHHSTGYFRTTQQVFHTTRCDTHGQQHVQTVVRTNGIAHEQKYARMAACTNDNSHDHVRQCTRTTMPYWEPLHRGHVRFAPGHFGAL